MATSNMLQQVAEVAAEAKFERIFANGATDDADSLKDFLVKLWAERKHEMFDDGKKEKLECLYGRFSLNFNLPKDLAFVEDEIKDVLCEHVEDFKGLEGKVFVLKNDGQEEHGQFRIVFNYEDEMKEVWEELKKKRKADREGSEEEGKKARKTADETDAQPPKVERAMTVGVTPA